MNRLRHVRSIQFGTDGWRGRIADDFTVANVCRVTRAIAQYLQATYSQERPVLVAYDTRFLADQFAQTAAEVLADEGWTVQVTERDCPTPVIAYHARFLQTAGALMFTASHNPACYCGIKYIPDYGGPATQDITDQIMGYLEPASDGPPQRTHLDRIVSFDPQSAYLRFLYTLLDVEAIRCARLQVKFDALYSTSRGYLDQALEYCGCQTETLHGYRDVLFGGGLPEPRGRQLQDLSQAVRTDRADVGLATDGDSDRFGVVDDRGNIVSPNAVLLLLTRHLIQNKGKTGAIVRTVDTTHLLDRLAAHYGLDLYETPVGFKHIGQKMRETAVLIGGEASGGLSILGHIPEKDGILANLLVVEMLAYEGKPLSQLVAEMMATVGGPCYSSRLDLHLTEAHKAAVLTQYADHPPQELAGIRVNASSDKDGIKLYLEDGGWVLLRPSGTEPLMRVCLETSSPDKNRQITEQIEQMIQQLQPIGA